MQMKIQIEEAGERFREMIELALKGTEVLIIDKQKAVVRLVRVEPEEQDKSEDKWTSDDFDIQVSRDS